VPDKEAYDHIDEAARRANEAKQEGDLVRGSQAAEAAIRAKNWTKESRDD
jgi:hypothetical protein